jgi:CBS domain-containing protein
VSGELIYAFRVMRLPLLDAGGSPIGRIQDLVAVPGRPGRTAQPAIAPRIVGFVASSQRRRIFVNANRLAELDNDGARLRSWDVDLNPFKPRPGEVLIGEELIDRQIGDETVSDLAIRQRTDGRSTWWEIDKVRLARKHLLRRRPSFRLVDYDEVPALFDAPTEMQAEAARLRDFHPAEVAAVLRALPVDQRRQLADALDDERLADVLEELSEDEQIRIVEQLDLDRLAGVLDEMEYDDLADLLGEMGPAEQERMLQAMDADDADVVRRLLSYEEGTAGGLMTPELIILGPQATVAEALAQIRDPDWVVSIASQVFVCQAPYKAPTGRLLGVVPFQRLLREPPSMELGRLVADDPTVGPDLPDREVAERLAAYDLLALAVVDEAGRLLGAVTVDDVIDRMLGAGWRVRQRPTPTGVS